MPYRNGTGPFGNGQMTGRGMGPCGRGRCNPYGWGARAITKEEEKEMLEQEKKDIEKRLEELK